MNLPCDSYRASACPVHAHMLQTASPCLSNFFLPSSTGVYRSWMEPWEKLPSLAVSSKSQLEQGIHLLQQFSNSHEKHERRQSLGLLQEFQLPPVRGICITCPPYSAQTRNFCYNCFLGFPHFTSLFRNKKKPSSHMQGAAKTNCVQMGSARGSQTWDSWKMCQGRLTVCLLCFLHSTCSLVSGHRAKCPFEMTQYNSSYTHSICRRNVT